MQHEKNKQTPDSWGDGARRTPAAIDTVYAGQSTLDEATVARCCDSVRTSVTERAEDIWQDFDETVDQLQTTVHAKQAAPRTVTMRAKSRASLLEFCNQYLVKRKMANLTWRQVMCREPALDLGTDVAFWKLFCKVFGRRSRKIKYTTSSQLLAALTVKQHLWNAAKTFREMTGKAVDMEVYNETQAYIDVLYSPAGRAKEIATFRDMMHTIKNGIFHNKVGKVLMHCARERIQAALAMLLIVYTASRPGEIVRSQYYIDSLRWKDVRFFLTMPEGKCDHKSLQMSCDVKIRNLKGMRAKPNMFKTQPLYADHALAPCADAVLMLAWLADQDNVIEGTTILHAIGNLDLSFFKTCSVLELQINSTVLEVPVFRTVQSLQDKDGHTYYGVADRFDNDVHMSWSTKNLGWALSKAATAVGIARFTMYTLRRATANALKDAKDVKSNDMRLAIGHSLGSHAFYNSYMSKRTVVDIQGIISHGAEERRQIAEHGLRRCAQDLSWTHADEQAVRSNPRVVDLQSKLDEAQQVYVALQNKDGVTADFKAVEEAASRVEACKLELKRTLFPLRAYRRRQVALEQHRLAQVAAAQGPSKANADVAREEAQVQMILAETRKDLLSNDDGAGENDADVNDDSDDDEFDIGPPQVSGKGCEHNEHLNEDDDDIDPALLAMDSADLASDTQGAPTAQKRSIALKTLLFDLAQEHSIAPPQLTESLEPLLQPTESGCLLSRVQESFRLFSSETGTRNASIAAAHDFRNCPLCKKSFADLLGNRRKTLTFGFACHHLQNCSKQPLIKPYLEACTAFLADTPCPHQHCMEKQRNFPTSYEAIRDHLESDFKRLLDKTGRCRYILDNGEQCDWHTKEFCDENGVFQHDSRKSNWTTAMTHHAEVAHGIPQVVRSSVTFCVPHFHVAYGLHQQYKHAAKHIELACTDTEKGWINHFCPFCLNDVRLAVRERGYYFQTPKARSSHILMAHVYAIRSKTTLCPICDEELSPAYILDHLLQRHDINVVKGNLRAGETIAPTFERLKLGYNIGNEGARLAWLRFVSRLEGFDNEFVHADIPSDEGEESKYGSHVRQKARFTGNRTHQEYPRHCPYCKLDEALEKETRERLLLSRRDQATHIFANHIGSDRRVKSNCPECKQECATADLPRHLEEHGFPLTTATGTLAEVGVPSFGKAANAKKLREEYLSWVEAGCPNTGKDYSDFRLRPVYNFKPKGKKRSMSRKDSFTETDSEGSDCAEPRHQKKRSLFRMPDSEDESDVESRSARGATLHRRVLAELDGNASTNANCVASSSKVSYADY